MKTLPLGLFALVLMTTAGQIAAQEICNDGRTPREQCAARLVYDTKSIPLSYDICMSRHSNPAESAQNVTICHKQSKLAEDVMAEMYRACMGRLRCSR